MSSTVRFRNESDIPAATAGLVTVHATDGYPVEGVTRPEAWLTPPGMLEAWVAEIAGNVVGHVAVSRSNGEEAARKRAVGECLVRAADGYAQSTGMRLVLDVMAKDIAAIRLGCGALPAHARWVVARAVPCAPGW